LKILPLAKEILNNSNDLIVDQDVLVEFLENIKKEFGLDYDISHIKEYEYPHLWHFHILTNESKRKSLIERS
jgi:hypothetical protein